MCLDDDFTLGPYLVQPSLGCVQRDGRTTHLRARVVDLLLFFCKHPDVVLPPRRLLDGVWGTAFVSYSALTRTMAELRGAFDDHPEQPWLFETIPKRGYRLLVCPSPARARDAATASGDAPNPFQPPTDGASAVRLWLRADNLSRGLRIGSHVLGRDPSADVVLSSPWVSRRHASIEVTENGATIRDLGSRNGTSLNGRQVTEAEPISHGAEIRIGHTRLLAYLVTPDVPTVADVPGPDLGPGPGPRRGD